MRVRLTAVIAAGLLTLSACGGAEETTAVATVSPAAESSPAAASPAKVSANDASEAELTEAFEAAGVSDAAKWAHEVEEYRPYPKDDPDFTKLREELADYNPGPGVVDKIVATLEP